MGRIDDMYQIVRTCPVCGKEFYPPTYEWAYIRKRRNAEPGKHAKVVIYYMCSWRCLREFDRLYPVKTGNYIDHGLRDNVPRKQDVVEQPSKLDLTKSETFGKLLKMALQNAGMSQKDLSRQSCGTPASISRYCRDKAKPNLKRLIRICHVLDIPLVIAERLLEPEKDNE